MTPYERALQELAALEPRGIRLGLDHVRNYCARAGDPQSRYPVFHVAGTNGKGATIATLEALAIESGLRTAVYSSPHLIDFRERIRVDRIPVSPETMVERWARVRDYAHEHELTYFEATTLLAFEVFAVADVDLALIEVGLGGRLDATTVVVPEATIITTIARDHERYLGHDLGSIASEKAGILKRGIPAFSAIARSSEVRSALEAAAAGVAARLRFVDEEVTVDPRDQVGAGIASRFDYEDAATRVDDIEIPLGGKHFIDDAALALWVWNSVRKPLPTSRIRRALADIQLPGRSEWRRVDGVDVLFDVAHNPDAMSALATMIASRHAPRVALVAGFLADKQWEAMLDRLMPLTTRGWVCGLPTAPAGRRLEARAAQSALRTRARIEWAETVADGLAAARRLVTAGDADLIVVTGSFYTVGSALLSLGLAEPGTPYHPRRARTMEVV